MGLWDTLKNWFKQDSKKYVIHRISSDHVEDPRYEDRPLKANQDYFRLFLAEMYLKQGRAWFSNWYPVAHSVVRFEFGGEVVDIPRVAGSTMIATLQEQDLSKRAALNWALTTFMPFNGGLVEMEAGLLGMKGSDDLKKLLKLVGDFSALLAVPQLSSALAVAVPLANGLQDLLGGGNGQMELNYQQTFAGQASSSASELRPGYIAVLLATEDDVDTEQLWVRGDRLHVGPTLGASHVLTGISHMLLRLEGGATRDDWASLKSISVPFQKAQDELIENGFVETEEFRLQYLATVNAVMSSPDLTKADRIRVAKAIKAEFDEIKGLKAVEEGRAGDLNDIVQRFSIPPEDALAISREAALAELLE